MERHFLTESQSRPFYLQVVNISIAIRTHSAFAKAFKPFAGVSPNAFKTRGQPLFVPELSGCRAILVDDDPYPVGTEANGELVF